MSKKNYHNRGGGYRFRFTVFIIVAVLLANLLVEGFALILISTGIIGWPIPTKISPVGLLFACAGICLVIGYFISATLGRNFTKPIIELSEATKKVAEGDFDVKVETEGHNELAILVKNFNKMVNDLKRNETLTSDFVASVSHEFKTPLTNIQGYAMLLQDDNLADAERLNYTQSILESTKSLTNLVTNILNLTKLENQDICLSDEPYSLDEQIRQSILLYETSWTEKELELDLDLEEVTISYDATLLMQVWNNLISNAIKYTPNGGNISISLKKDENTVIVVVADSGIGISEESQNRIFDKFYQDDNSHFNSGNGLGLSIVKRIIELVNGEIEVISEEGKGSQFVVRLPL